MLDRTSIERAMTERAQKAAPLLAEIDEATRPGYWYLFICSPDCDAKASRWLVRRRFGIFQPMERVNVDHVPRLVPVFPGYIFVYVWDLEKSYSRIVSCPGVEEALMEFDRPVPIPDSFINRLRALSWVQDESAAGVRVARNANRRRSNPKRRARKSHKISTPQSRKADRLLRKHWENAVNLAPSERIGLLLQTVMPPVAASLAGPPVKAAGTGIGANAGLCEAGTPLKPPQG